MHMMNGTPSIPAYYAALAGLDIVNEVGVERIRESSKRMTARLLARVDEYGFTSVASRDPGRLAGTVAVDVPDAPLVSRTLKARDFVVDYRPPVGIRDLAALLQHDGRSRSGDGGDRVHHEEEGLCRRRCLEPRDVDVRRFNH